MTVLEILKDQGAKAELEKAAVQAKLADVEAHITMFKDAEAQLESEIKAISDKVYDEGFKDGQEKAGQPADGKVFSLEELNAEIQPYKDEVEKLKLDMQAVKDELASVKASDVTPFAQADIDLAVEPLKAKIAEMELEESEEDEIATQIDALVMKLKKKQEPEVQG